VTRYYEQIFLEYVTWFVTPKRLRKQFGLPNTDAEFANLKGVSERTVRRWKQREDFMPMVEQQKRRVAENAKVSAVAVGPARAATHGNSNLVKDTGEFVPSVEDDRLFEEGISQEELQFRQAKDAIFEKAAEGNQQAFDLMMKYWGSQYVDAERTESQLFREMSDEDLIRELLSAVGAERVAEFLAVSGAS
jgi:hypothetical protein